MCLKHILEWFEVYQQTCPLVAIVLVTDYAPVRLVWPPVFNIPIKTSTQIMKKKQDLFNVATLARGSKRLSEHCKSIFGVIK